MPTIVTPAIPASQIVDVLPSVLPAGGNALDLLGLLLTQSTRPPIGVLLSFADQADVASYFGALSQEAALASIYFNGTEKSTATPGAFLIAQYPENAVGAYLRGGNIQGTALTTLQGYSGTLSVTIDGVIKSGTVNLASATSFSSAATIIGDALNIVGPVQASGTASIAGTVMTVSALPSGTLSQGQIVAGTGVVVGTYITGQLSGTVGGVGTYSVQPSQSMSSSPITAGQPGVSYDSISGGIVIQSSTTGVGSTIGFASGALAPLLFLTQGSGAVTSQGAAATSPGLFMPTVVAKTMNWLSFTTTWEPSTTEKEAFATWTDAQKNRFLYCAWDTNILNTEASGPSPFAAFVNNGNLSGIAIVYENPLVNIASPGQLAALIMGWAASLDFQRTNGRQTAAFQTQTGLAPHVTDATVAAYLESYGLTYYGDFTTANQAFIWLYNGQVSGPFLWLDAYVDQVWFTNQLQLALMVLLNNVGSIPYNDFGYSLITAAVLDPINQAVNFGAIRSGIPLSAAQIAEVNAAAGLPIDGVLSQRGWYFQVLPAAPAVRQARGSPPCTLWFTDGGAVQRINLNSIDVF